MSRTAVKETEVFKFDELSEESQNIAICDEIDLSLEIFTYEEMSDNMKKACDRADQMRTPWFAGSYVYDYCKDEMIENIKLNEREFTADGKYYS